MEKSVDCQVHICPNCINELSAGVWLSYYEQYYATLKFLNQEFLKNSNMFLPTVLLLAQYIEIWTKTIAVNYGSGQCGEIATKKLFGHEFDSLIEGFVDVLDDGECERNIEKISDIYESLMWFTYMTDNGENLSISMRYPVTRNNLSSMSPCVFNYLTNECCGCDEFNLQLCHEKIEKILKLSYEVYDDIYASRVV